MLRERRGGRAAALQVLGALVAEPAEIDHPLHALLARHPREVLRGTPLAVGEPVALVAAPHRVNEVVGGGDAITGAAEARGVEHVPLVERMAGLGEMVRAPPGRARGSAPARRALRARPPDAPRRSRSLPSPMSTSAVGTRPCRCATAAASVRERTFSFDRMRDTCTLGRLLGHVEALADLAVRGARGHQPEHVALARGQPEGVLGSSPSVPRPAPAAPMEPRPRGQRLHLLGEPRAPDAARARERLSATRGGVAVARSHQGLGLAPAAIGRGIGPARLLPASAAAVPQSTARSPPSPVARTYSASAVATCAASTAKPDCAATRARSRKASARARDLRFRDRSRRSRAASPMSASTRTPWAARAVMRMMSSEQNSIRSRASSIAARAASCRRAGVPAPRAARRRCR